MEYKLDTPNREELVQTQTRVALFALETAFGALNSLACKAPENTDINVRDAIQQIRAAQRNVAFLASHLTTTDHYTVLGGFIAHELVMKTADLLKRENEKDELEKDQE